MSDFFAVFIAPLFFLAFVFVAPFAGVALWNILKGNTPWKYKNEVTDRR
jgi:hypothetical protein